METWLGELRSPTGEGPLRGADRQVRAAFRLVNRDPAIKRLIGFEALALTALWVGFFLLERQTGSLGREADRVFQQWLYWAASIGVSLVISVAIACAVDMKIDGVGADLPMVLAEMRKRLPTLFCWWLISMGASVVLGFALRAVTRPGLAALALAVLWGVGTLFVVPAIALQNGGPLEALGEACRLLRARWGRALVGVFAIGIFFGLGLIASGFLLRATAEGHPRSSGESVWRFAGPLALLYLAYALTSATREGFAVILARDALGDLPGEPAAAKPGRRASTILKRVAIGAVALAVGLLILGAILGHHRSNTQPADPQTYVPTTPPTHVADDSAASFAYPIRDPDARRLRPGAPVVLAGRTIGRVSMIHVSPTSPVIEIFYEVDPRREGTVIHSRMRVAMRDGMAHLVVVPDQRR